MPSPVRRAYHPANPIIASTSTACMVRDATTMTSNGNTGISAKRTTPSAIRSAAPSGSESAKRVPEGGAVVPRLAPERLVGGISAGEQPEEKGERDRAADPDGCDEERA